MAVTFKEHAKEYEERAISQRLAAKTLIKMMDIKEGDVSVATSVGILHIQ
ncbi:hypothetical protein ACGP04_10705 [Piscirickettsia salmonis]